MQTLSGLKNAFRIYKGCSNLSLNRMSCKTPHTLAANDKRTCYTKVHGVQSIAPLVRSVEETPEPIPTIVKGTIPNWIHGSLLRNGPGKFEFGNQHYNHWFDGMALLHRFQIDGGQVTYRSRFLQSDSYKQNSERNRIMVSEFGTLALPDPCKNIFQRFLSRFEMTKPTDNASVSFIKYKGDYYVSTETNFMHRVDPETLETKQKVDWSKFLAVNAATAHPHIDPDGTAYNMGNSYGKKGTFYNIIMVPPKTEGPEDTLNGAKILCSIAPHDKFKPSYYHSFGMSENYVVFIEQPIKMDLYKIMTSKLKGKALSDGIYWDPNQETIFHLIDKHTGKESPVKYNAKAMSTFHQINAFEQDGFLMLDMCCSDDGNAINNYLIQNMRKSGEALDKMYDSIGRPYPRRFVLPLNITKETPLEQNLNTRCDSKATAVCRTENQITKEDILKKVGNHSVLAPIHFYRMDTKPMQVKGGQLTTSFKISSFVFSGRKKVIQVYCTFEDLHGDDLNDYGGVEFPHINYARYNTKPYRYFYGCGFRNLVGDSLIKMDLGSKKFKVWCQPDLYPSEPVFIPSPNAVEEDDGIILSVVITPTKNQSSFLLVLDAKTFEELGRAEVPVNIPYGFHGTFSSSV